MNKYHEMKNYVENEGYQVLTKEYEYIDCKTIIKTICPNNHEWCVSYGNFKYGLRCAICKSNDKKKNKYNEIKKYIEDEGYELIDNEYNNNSTLLHMKCP